MRKRVVLLNLNLAEPLLLFHICRHQTERKGSRANFAIVSAPGLANSMWQRNSKWATSSIQGRAISQVSDSVQFIQDHCCMRMPATRKSNKLVSCRLPVAT